MNDKKENSLTFHNQDAALQIALWLNVIAWAILVLYLINFANDIDSIVQSWPIQMPSTVTEKLMMYAGFLSKPMFGAMYFLVLQGISQLLYLGVDIFFTGEEVEEEETVSS